MNWNDVSGERDNIWGEGYHTINGADMPRKPLLWFFSMASFTIETKFTEVPRLGFCLSPKTTVVRILNEGKAPEEHSGHFSACQRCLQVGCFLYTSFQLT